MSLKKTPTENQQLFSPTPSTSAELNEWLDSAINAKAGHMRFDPPSAVDFDQNSPINISRFGFKNPGDLKVFLLSPAGEAKVGEIGAKLSEDRAIDEQRRLDYQEETKRHSLIKIHLLLWLMEKEAHADSVLRDHIDEFNHKAIEQSKPAPQNTQKTQKPKASNKNLEAAMANYDATIRQYQQENHKLGQHEEKLDERLESLEQQQAAMATKHDVYGASLAAFAQESDEYESLKPEDLDTLIDDMEHHLDAQTEQIINLLETGDPADEEEARLLLNKQNALNLQIASLKDLRSTQQEEGAKKFFNAEGNPVSSQKDASFITNHDQKIGKKGDEYYLLKAGQDIDKLSDAEKEDAKEGFKSAQHELMTVKKAVEHTHESEKDFFSTQINEVNAQKEQNGTERRTLENQIKLMQSVRATLSQPNAGLEKDAQSMPTPTMSGKMVAVPAPPKSAITFAHSIVPVFGKLFSPSISKDKLSKQIDEHAKDHKLSPKDAKEIKEFMKKAMALLGLGKILSIAPLPQTTMESLLKNMARFGADPYKPGLTPIQSPMSHSPMQTPMDSTTPKSTPKPAPEPEPGPRFNPSPFATKPY